MESLDQLSKQLVETSVGWVPAQVMESRDDSKRLIRRQEILGPHRFTMLIRYMSAPTQHLCGYVHVTQREYLDIFYELRSLALSLQPTYAGPGTRDIAWRWFNPQRKLVSAGKVTHGDDADFWVGIAFSVGMDEARCIERLAAFESEVNRIRQARR